METHRAAEAFPPVAPRARSQGRGGRHHLVSRPRVPGHKGRAAAASRGAGRAEEPHHTLTPGTPTPGNLPPGSPVPTHLQAEGGTAAPQELADVAQALALRPRLRVHLQEKRPEELELRGRTDRPAQHGAALPRPAAPPHLPFPPTLRRRLQRRRRSLPALNREVNREHRKWRARAGGGRRAGARAGVPRPGAAPPALPRRGAGGWKGGREARPGPALPRPAPPQLQPQARPAEGRPGAPRPQASPLRIF